MTDRNERLKSIRERLDAARYMNTAFAIKENAPVKTHVMQLAIRTAAYPLLQNAPSDIEYLIDLVERHSSELESRRAWGDRAAAKIAEYADQITKLQAENERLASGLYRDDHRYHPLKETCDQLREENERLKEELAKWKNIEQLAECTYKEIYANVYKLKPGKYAPNARDLPCCNCGDPDNAKIHDEICDILEERGFNGADVCTASVGIWAALAWYERLKAKLAEVEAELDNKRGAMMLEIKRLHELADREREAAKVMREAWRQSLELFTPNPGEELTEYGEGAKQTIEQMREQYEEALAKADEIRGKNE